MQWKDKHILSAFIYSANYGYKRKTVYGISALQLCFPTHSSIYITNNINKNSFACLQKMHPHGGSKYAKMIIRGSLFGSPHVHS